jgi:4,5-DOPA dioxygenase extradiol
MTTRIEFEEERMSRRMPVIFAAHGAPILLDDPVWMGKLAAWAKAMPRPKSILMVSAHWEGRPATLGATRRVPLVYDFYGFPLTVLSFRSSKSEHYEEL